MNKRRPLRVYFEEAGVWEMIWMLYFRFARGAEIVVFDFSHTMRRSRIGRWLLDEGHATLHYVRPNTCHHGDAIDVTQKAADVLFKSAAYRAAQEVYGSAAVRQVFRKVLLAHIFRCIHINRWLDGEREAGQRIVFVPRDYREAEGLIRRVAPEALKDAGHVRMGGGLGLPALLIGLARRARIFIRLTAISTFAAGAVLIRRFDRRPAVPEAYDNAFCVFQKFILLSTDRGIGFMMNGETLKKQRSLILVYCQVDEAQEPEVLKEHPYFLVRSIMRPKNLRLWPPDGRFVGSVLKFWSVCLREPWMRTALWEALLPLARGYVLFSVLSRRFTIRNYVYANNEGPEQICFNVLARQAGWTTWNYLLFLGGGYLRCRNGDFASVRNVLWAFLVYDHLVAPNEDLVRYYKMHYQDVKHHHVVGFIFTESIRTFSPEQCARAFARMFPRHAREAVKVIGVFDTTFINSPLAPTSYDDAIRFYLDMARFLQDHPDCVMIFKPAKGDLFFKDGEFGSPRKAAQLLPLLEALRGHPRVFWARGQHLPLGQDQQWNNLVIAMSDIVVSHCMSSPTGEALSVGRKGIWYESGRKDVGVLYDAIPGLVTHGYPEFVRRMEELLYRTGAEAYSDYLQRHIKGSVDDYLDGDSFRRFQWLLTGGVTSSGKAEGKTREAVSFDNRKPEDWGGREDRRGGRNFGDKNKDFKSQ